MINNEYHIKFRKKQLGLKIKILELNIKKIELLEKRIKEKQ